MFFIHEQKDVTGVKLRNTDLLNAFLINDDITLLATTKGFLVLDSEYKLKKRLIYRDDLFTQKYDLNGRSLCCTPGKTTVGNTFNISFTHGLTIDKKLRSENRFESKNEEDEDEMYNFANYGHEVTL